MQRKRKQRFLRLNLLLLSTIVALGVVLWYRSDYDPQVAIPRALPKGHRLVQRVNADVDGDMVRMSKSYAVAPGVPNLLGVGRP